MEEFQKTFSQFQDGWLELQHSSLVISSYKLKEEEEGCVRSVKHCRTYMKHLKNEINHLCKNAKGDEISLLEKARLDILKKEYLLRDIEDVLPRAPGLYLRIVLGALNISFANKEDKYKNDYEQFKIILSGICAVFAFILYFFIQNRIVDTLFHFLLVWYYCTLTIRERILIANGSRIKGWWNISHFMSTVNSGIMLIWPRSHSYDEYRDQFMLFALYLNLVHFIQYQYQISCLYKLRTLGCRHPMDITVDGFMSWMFRRITFILPFLFGVYGFELYMSYNLYIISQQDYCHEWQVLVVSMLYFVLAMGSIVTVLQVIRQKICAPPPIVLHDHLTKKYSFARPSEKFTPGDEDDDENKNEVEKKIT